MYPLKLKQMPFKVIYTLMSLLYDNIQFAEKPPTPPYVPRKTGIDASTQVWDVKELFDFDKEVSLFWSDMCMPYRWHR
jgi:hypothetical protein